MRAELHRKQGQARTLQAEADRLRAEAGELRRAAEEAAKREAAGGRKSAAEAATLRGRVQELVSCARGLARAVVQVYDAATHALQRHRGPDAVQAAVRVRQEMALRSEAPPSPRLVCWGASHGPAATPAGSAAGRAAGSAGAPFAAAERIGAGAGRGRRRHAASAGERGHGARRGHGGGVGAERGGPPRLRGPRGEGGRGMPCRSLRKRIGGR